jgi:RNA-directed DNA polymerase
VVSRSLQLLLVRHSRQRIAGMTTHRIAPSFESMSADIYAFENLWRQYRNCRRNKRNTINALAFEIDAEAQLVALQQDLREHAYRPGPSICFVTDGPKPREVFAADFRDRVVHHLLVSRLEPVFERCFIHDSYACRKGKGVLAASDRLMTFLRQATANGRRPTWALKLDIASFFPSIHKKTLFAIICRHVRDPELRWLTETILFHDPTKSYRFKRGPGRVPPPGAPQYPIPAQKSLFGKAGERGLPIGNLTSQFWANVYLNELDHFVKRTLGCRHYVRYVDDLILLHDTPEALRRWREEIARFAADQLLLRLREPDVEPRPVSRGIEFVGWKTFWNHRVPRRQTLARCGSCVREFQGAELRPLWGGAALRIDLAGKSGQRTGRLQAGLASYSGHLRHGCAYRAWQGLWRRHEWLDALFVRAATAPWRVRGRWPERILSTLRFSRQYGQLIRSAGKRALVFCQVGGFVEFYGPQREQATRALRLVRVNVARGGHASSVGFPARVRGEYISRAVRAGYVVVDVREVGRIAPRCAQRRVVALYLPALKARSRSCPSGSAAV